jgi:hypothetical protein
VPIRVQDAPDARWSGRETARTSECAREREFRLLWFSRVVSDFGDRFGTSAWRSRCSRSRGPQRHCYVLAARTIASIALFLVAGVWADRLPRQRVMLASDVGRGIATAAMAVLLLTGHAEIWHLVVLAAVYGAAEAFFGPASQGLVPQTVSPARLQQANGLMSLSRNVTAFAGPAAAGHRALQPRMGSPSRRRRSASARRSCSSCSVVHQAGETDVPHRPPGRLEQFAPDVGVDLRLSLRALQFAALCRSSCSVR